MRKSLQREVKVAELGWNSGLSQFALENGGDPDPAEGGEGGWQGEEVRRQGETETEAETDRLAWVNGYFLSRKSWCSWP